MNHDKYNEIDRKLYNNHPIYIDKYGVERFEEEPLTIFLYNFIQSKDTINNLYISIMKAIRNNELTIENLRELDRGIGYSLCGFHDLSNNSNEVLIRDFGIDMVVGNDPSYWKYLEDYFGSCNKEAIIKSIGKSNAIKLFSNTNIVFGSICNFGTSRYYSEVDIIK